MSRRGEHIRSPRCAGFMSKQRSKSRVGQGSSLCMKVVWAEHARDRLADIYSYIERDFRPALRTCASD